MEAVKTEPIYSTIFGNSGDVMAAICKLYIPAGAVIADMTYGRGVFWKKINVLDYTILGSDIVDKPGIALRQDARKPALRDGSCDVVVLDPPFGNMSTTPRTRMQDSYELHSVRTPISLRIWNQNAIKAAHKTLKAKGILVVKCQDMINSGRQHWFTINIHRLAYYILDMEPLDRFTLIPPTQPTLRHPNTPQKHARKWGSTFWVFQKRKGA